jgi:hypothetical protein
MAEVITWARAEGMVPATAGAPARCGNRQH